MSLLVNREYSEPTQPPAEIVAHWFPVNGYDHLLAANPNADIVVATDVTTRLAKASDIDLNTWWMNCFQEQAVKFHFI